MDARDLENSFNYLGQERSARKLIIDEGLAKPEEVALMPCLEVCEKLLEFYDVVGYMGDSILVVKKSDAEVYKSIVKCLSR